MRGAGVGNRADVFRDHETHRHKWYGLTCEVYDEMLDACDYSCQVCGCPSDESSCGKLVIDHDGQVGNWAVRGLLCTKCNVTLRVDRDDPHWAVPYLANPWYRRMLAEKGLMVNPPEPTDWTMRDGYLFEPQVVDAEGCVWTRLRGKWADGYDRNGITWSALLATWGPHNLRPRDVGGTPITAAEVDVMRGGKGPLEVTGASPEARIDIALVLIRKKGWPSGSFDKLQEVAAALQGETVVI